MKLAAEDVPFLRIGRAGQVHPHLHDWMPGGGHTLTPQCAASGHRTEAAGVPASEAPSSLPACPPIADAHVAHAPHELLRATY